MEGQIVQGGIGYGLLEEIMWEDEKTHDVTFSYYKMPTSLETPQFYMDFINTHGPYGPFGAKALGRIAIVAAPATIANAIYDATEIGVKDLPITPDKIIEAL